MNQVPILFEILISRSGAFFLGVFGLFLTGEHALGDYGAKEVEEDPAKGTTPHRDSVSKRPYTLNSNL